jgi:hypothetical protein
MSILLLGMASAGPLDDFVARMNDRMELPFFGTVTVGTALLVGSLGLLVIGWIFLRRK